MWNTFAPFLEDICEENDRKGHNSVIKLAQSYPKSNLPGQIWYEQDYIHCATYFLTIKQRFIDHFIQLLVEKIYSSSRCFYTHFNETESNGIHTDALSCSLRRSEKNPREQETNDWQNWGIHTWDLKKQVLHGQTKRP